MTQWTRQEADTPWVRQGTGHTLEWVPQQFGDGAQWELRGPGGAIVHHHANICDWSVLLAARVAEQHITGDWATPRDIIPVEVVDLETRWWRRRES